MALIPLPPPPPRHPVRHLALAMAALLFLFIMALIFGEPLAELRDQRTFPIPGRAVKVGDDVVHLVVSGQHASQPTVVIDGDLGLPAAAWSQLVQELSKTTQVVTWDRPGYGWSPFGSQPHDGLTLARQLHTALVTRDTLGPYVQSVEIPGPYLLVGQGLGAAHMRIFASEFPDDVAGLILLDGMYPGDPLDAWQTAHRPPSGEAWKRRLMARRLDPLPDPIWMQAVPSRDRAAVLAMFSKVDMPKAEAAEVDAIADTLAQSLKIQSLGNKPVRILVSEQRSDPAYASHIRQGQFLARLSTQGDCQVVPPALPFISMTDGGQPAPLLQAIFKALGNP